jgi:DNA-binding CsgD family transcriptional regulator
MINLPKLQALIAPLSAPIPSALGVAVQAYLYFLPQSAFLGWIAAFGAFIGIEAIGGASCYAVVSLHRQKNYGIEFIVSLIGIIAYVSSGLLTLNHTPLLIFFFLAPFSYFAYAVLRNMEVELVEKRQETEAQLKLVIAQKNLANAEARKVKLINVQRSIGYIPKECREDVRILLEQDRTLSAREIGRKLGISPTTASEHKKIWEKENE